MKLVRESLNEELVGTWEGRNFYNNNKPISVDVYKNPTSMKRLAHWCRAITDLKGNLFIADNPGMIHMDMYEYLCKKGELPGNYYDTYYDTYAYDNSIAWQRLAGTNKLYLGESYDDEIFLDKSSYFMKEMIGWAKRLPKLAGIKFVMEKITINRWFEL